ncbi:MAG: ketol-acid reductoisomerase [Chloroflexi bacterium]|nr:ketol-acid reductoisomerase [Chloroflexota bacterium]
MAKVYHDADAELGLLKGKTIGVVGFGSQGKAHSQNLRDSGLKVVVGLRADSSSRKEVAQAGLAVDTVEAVARDADIIMMLIPDVSQGDVYAKSIAPAMKAGKTIMFAHGFNIHYKQVMPPQAVDVSMVAPKAPGPLVRRLYTEGAGTPALFAVHQDASGQARQIALAYAKGIGCTRAGVLETTFAEETETDLFGEQAVLCGGVSALVKAGFETLVAAGYQPELAYFECLHELKLIVDLIYAGGLTRMREAVSDTAEYGDYVSGPRIVDDRVKETMRRVLKEIQDGSFAQRWIAENREGRGNFLGMRQAERNLRIEEVGKELRSMMPWLGK